MKRSRLSYDEWECIRLKNRRGTFVDTELFSGYIGLIDILEVSEKQLWKFHGEDIVVCDKGIKWLSILPRDDYYCITAMMNDEWEILLWYVDMIADQGIDPDGIPYFDDLYLDLVVYPDGTIIVDDMDELEEALAGKNISQEQFELAIKTSERLKDGLLHDIFDFRDFTMGCCKILKEAAAALPSEVQNSSI